ncbi:MAG: site-specific DNA-methyltransferase, partial [Acidobacteria bacterium]|nr:site-specific DNA-methyltransferase [Acidobacteriota bacterium]
LEEYWFETSDELEFVRKNPETGKIENWFPPRSTRIASSLWLDVHAYENQKLYPTAKHEDFIERILAFASRPGSLVLDCFVGSGTTSAVAQRLGRRWIGCDINRGSIQTTAKRLQSVMREQVEKFAKRPAPVAQAALPMDPEGSDPEPNVAPEPAQLSFSVWRVNDYDLQIQHNEAVNLACEHIGIERTRADGFFDGTLSKHLAKIIPFDHALSPVDLEELRRELDSRPDEDREITLVCLGIEIAARGWVDDWNRLRKGKNAANRLHVIELRSDETYGAFIRHEPASARMRIARKGPRVTVVIEDFVSPSIIERLRQQAGVLQPKIDDWRAMVDSVAIDSNWNGSVFNVALSDTPEKKTDLVKGSYEIDIQSKQTTVAVRITDMLGEEVLVTTSV